MNEWISVKNKLPDKEGECLVFSPSWKQKTKILIFASHIKGSRMRFWWNGCETIKVTHWQPLPEPPE
jgi:hypothetical protein